MGKYRMYEPWGYREENGYQSDVNEAKIALDEFFAKVNYNKDDNKIHFGNKYGKEVASLDVNEFLKSDSIVEEAKYEDGKIVIKFTNGDVITIDVEELLDENEFKDGLQVNSGEVSVLIDGETEKSYVTEEPYLTVSEDGVKVEGVNLAVSTEKDRAVAEESRLDAKIDQEIADRVEAVAAERARAEAEESALNRRSDQLNDEVDAEKTIREANDLRLTRLITEEAMRASSSETAIYESAFFDASYDESGMTIDFFNKGGGKVCSIDASQFIIVGMIESVEVQEIDGVKYLVITFNSTSGPESVKIPLSDIFDSNEYYDKDEIDEKLAQKADVVHEHTLADIEGIQEFGNSGLLVIEGTESINLSGGEF